jgi:hypothetical protein
MLNKITPLTLELASKVPCPAIPQCSLQTNFSIDFAHGILANNVKKILMEITPKWKLIGIWLFYFDRNVFR